jgi:plastocyanin
MRRYDGEDTVTRPTVCLGALTAIGMAIGLTIAAGCSKSESGPPAPKAAVTPVDLSTAGTIQVQVSYDGPVPTGKVINMSGTPGCAAAHPQPVVDDSIAVSDGRLANAVVYIKSGLGDRAFAAPAEPVIIDQKGCLYDPRVVAVMVGQPLQFRNSDQEAHNVHGRPTTVDAWNFLMSRPGSTRDVVFDRPEVGIPIGCDVHPWMRAYASVFASPYFGVTPRDGTVTLKPVPPGDFVIGVWHEALGSLEKSVTLPPSGTVSVPFAYGAPAR